MISQTSKIAIKAVIFLSDVSLKGERYSIDEISKQIDASKHTVGKALQKLAKAGIVNSLKGPNGGFYLDEKQQNKAIYEIVEVIEGADVFNRCGLGITECSDSQPCPLHNDYKEVRKMLTKIFNERKIKDLRMPVNDGSAFLFQ